MYLAYFGAPLDNLDKGLAPHQVCITCVETLRSWFQGNNAKPYCYFCLVNVKGFNNKQHLPYPSIQSAIRLISFSDKIPIPIFTKLPESVEDK